MVEDGYTLRYGFYFSPRFDKSLPRGLGQLARAQALQTESCVAYVETGTYSLLFYLKYIPKVLQGSLKGKQSR